MKTLPMGILMDNESGVMDIETVVGILHDYLPTETSHKIMNSGLGELEFMSDEFWDEILSDTVDALQGLAPLGCAVTWLENHPGVLVCEKIEEC